MKTKLPAMLVGLSVILFLATPFALSAAVSQQSRSLSFADRVAYQRAIENVYWQHRIWPRPDPKPSLDSVMSQATIEKEVQAYLRQSELLEQDWQKPITPEQLQTEMDRMAQHSKQPEVLRELFAALGNDPYVIAECLARPMLSARLITNLSAHDQEGLGSQSIGEAQDRVSKATAVAATNYKLPAISDQPSECDDSWTDTNTTSVPTGRDGHSVVWT